MDAKTKDIRFGCSVCPPQKRNATCWMKSGYKWRELVLHCTVRMHSPDAFVVLPSDVVAKVKESEMTNPHRQKSQWTCGHCTVHFGELELRKVVVAHLISVHGINSPREPEDLFLFTRNSSLPTFEASYEVNSPASTKTIRCLKCAKGKPAEKDRLFDINGVKNHLSAKHKVTSHVAGIHYL